MFLNRSNEAQQGESSTVSPVCANFRQAFTQSAMEWVSATANALGFGERVEGFVELGVVGSEIDQCAAFAAHQVIERGVVVAFVESPDDEHRGLGLCVRAPRSKRRH